MVADILNLTGARVEKSVLDQMDGQDPDEAVRNLMFTFADIAKLSDREVQIVLQEVDQKDLIIALRAADTDLKGKILGNLSETPWESERRRCRCPAFRWFEREQGQQPKGHESFPGAVLRRQHVVAPPRPEGGTHQRFRRLQGSPLMRVCSFRSWPDD